MAENKYDLLLVSTNLEGKVIRKQPWYRERLKTKYIKQRKKSETAPSLVGRNWMLVRSGMDDFRSGVPLDFKGQYVFEGSRGISPVFRQNKDSTANRMKKENLQKDPQPDLTKSQILFDKQLPQQKKRRNYIDELEYGLTQHPLALYPHLEEGMSPELFEEIVDLLDPAMNPDVESDAERTESNLGQTTSAEQGTEEVPDVPLESTTEEKRRRSLNSKARNPYKWILLKNTAHKDDKKGFKKRPTSPSQDEHIKKVTKDFCDWVSGLGGDINNVEESTIMSLFASGYETKPALSVPIHVVELSNVPAELRISAGLSLPGSARRSKPSSAVPANATNAENASKYQPSWVKIKYGAWYLDPETWKVRLGNEPLEDPEEIAKREMSESKQKSAEMDSQLAPLHGAKAFRDFLEKNGKRKPAFMSRVAHMQDEETSKGGGLHLKLSRNQSRNTTSNRRTSVAADSSFTFTNFSL